MKTIKTIEVKVLDIKIGNRFRKEMGDLDELAKSINDGELFHAIGITPDNELVFGERRLRAYRDVLNRETIPARIVDVKSVQLGQITENSMRKEFTISERIAIVESLCCFTHGGDRRSDQARNSELGWLTLSEACKLVGFSEDSYRRAKEVEQTGVPDLVHAMDSGKLSIYASQKLAQATPDEQQECLTKRLDEGRATARTVEKHLRRIRNRNDREQSLARAVESPLIDDSIQIYHCPLQKLERIAGLEPDSASLICTDIPYGSDFVEEIEALAQLAERALAPGGTFVAYVGQHRLDDKLALLGKHLKYQWLSTSVWEGPGNDVSRLKLVSKSIPIVIFSKGRWRPPNKWLDSFVTNEREKNWHHWQRPLKEVEKLVYFFSKPGDLVVDPCGGGFTTAIACLKHHRRFVGCDIDKAAVVKGQERLALERSGEILPMVNSEPIALNAVVQGDCRDLKDMVNSRPVPKAG